MKKNIRKNNPLNSNNHKKLAIIGSTILVLILGLSIRSAYLKPVDINMIGSEGQIAIEGTLIKDSPIGVPGNYMLVNMTGHIIQVISPDNLDSFVGTIVKVSGVTTTSSDNDIPQTINVQTLELLSTQ